MKLRSIGIVLCLGLGAAVSTASGVAEAQQSTTCNVSKVAWHPSSGGTVQILCGGVFRYAFGSHASCPTADADTRKAWFSLAQSAILSGKQLTLEFNQSCAGGPALTNVYLNQ
ncbi:MAG TPA: hypothetical protein VFZ53_15460 [Polyangiaceae bacterium]